VKWYPIAFILIIAITGCNNSSTPVTPGRPYSSKTSQIFEPDGKTPAGGVSVQFFDLSIESDTPSAMFTTNEAGVYSIGALRTGLYTLWAEKDSLVLFQDSIRVTDDSATLCGDTLHRPLSIKGVVRIHPAHDPRTVTIRLPHSRKQIKVSDSSGTFILRGLDEGTYTLKCECNIPGYLPFNRKITVVPFLLFTPVDTISMIYNSTPVVSFIQHSIDTLTGVIRLSWNKITSPLFQDYVLYKGVCDDFRFPDSILAVTKDTFFFDTSYYHESAFPGDTLLKCEAYRIAVRLTTQETGSFSRNVPVTIIPKSFVTTFFSSKIIYPKAGFSNATINDTVLICVSVQNRTRSLESLEWYDARKRSTLTIFDVSHLKQISDTIAYTFDSLGSNRIIVYVYDNANTRWSTNLNVQIIADKPDVFICNDTSVLVGMPVTLHASAKQEFGFIEHYEWKFGNGDWIFTSTPDTVIMAPATEQVTVCSLAVTDDDGYREKKMMRIHTSLPACKVAACSSHSFILKVDSTLLAFGEGGSGQLGDGSSFSYESPVAVMSGVQSVSAGCSHSMIIRSDGSLWACGDNQYGQLGDGTTTKRDPPVPVMNNVGKVIAGTTHTLILTNDGTLWACGSNACGQLGDGTKQNRSTPVQVMTDVMNMAAGSFHSVILKNDGTVWTCGENGGGQLGTGSTYDCLSPVQILSNIKSVAAGGWHSLFITATGELWGCGNNGYGQLGDGTIERRLLPVKIMDDIKEIDASVYYSLFLTTDGTLMVSGLNPTGQMPSQNRYSPLQLMTEVQGMAAGWLHYLILKKNGEVWSCGKNSFGQLGDGSNLDRQRPVCIIPPGLINK
jgi:alpha-tubulin suppressor-like RCC1 family protein